MPSKSERLTKLCRLLYACLPAFCKVNCYRTQTLCSQELSRELHGKGFNGIAAAFKPYFTRQKKWLDAVVQSTPPLDYRAVEACSQEWWITILSLAIRWMSLAVARRTVLAWLHWDKHKVWVMRDYGVGLFFGSWAQPFSFSERNSERFSIQRLFGQFHTPNFEVTVWGRPHPVPTGIILWLHKCASGRSVKNSHKHTPSCERCDGITCSLAFCVCSVVLFSCKEAVCLCTATIWACRLEFWVSSCLSWLLRATFSACRVAFWEDDTWY